MVSRFLRKAQFVCLEGEVEDAAASIVHFVRADGPNAPAAWPERPPRSLDRTGFHCSAQSPGVPREAESFAVGAVGGHGVERVGDGEDARP